MASNQTAFQSYRDLIVWQEAMSLAEIVYATTAALPKAEQYGLTSQVRRSAVSVAANVAGASFNPSSFDIPCSIFNIRKHSAKGRSARR